MNKTTSIVMNALVVLVLTLATSFHAGASSSNPPEMNESSQRSLLVGENLTPYGQPATGWNLVFADEFSGTSLDLTKWRPNWLGPDDTSITKPVNSAELSCYDPKQVTVVNGELNLTAVQRTCSSWNYASGLIESDDKFNFTYGYMEARMWTPAGTGVWPAFWTDGQNWPTDGEIDVLEAYGTDRSTFHYHYAGCGGDCNPGGEVNIPGATAGWHVYAAYWQPGSITWYYDGQQVWQYTTSIVSVPHFIILNLGLNAKPASLPATLRVDYVRVWKNAPASPTPTTVWTQVPPTATPTLVGTKTSTPVPATTTASSTPLPTNTPASSEIVMDDRNTAFTYSSGWQEVANVQANNGAFKQTGQNGASVTIPFTGSSLSVIYTAGPEFRNVDVYVDNILVGTINERTGKLVYKQRWDYSGQLLYGNHSLKLVFVGGRKTNIQGSVDAIVVR